MLAILHTGIVAVLQYVSHEYRQALERLQALQSMSRNGDCWDNAAMESFFATLNLEPKLDKAQENCAETRHLVFGWIEVFTTASVVAPAWATAHRLALSNTAPH